MKIEAISRYLSDVTKFLPKSLWVYHLNTGSCNGCDIEILAALTPRYDVERFGIKLVGSPRHADVLLVTGPVTKNLEKAVKMVYNQVPDPKVVMVVGVCGITGGVFRGSYNILEGANKIIPVDVYVPGCPVRPEAIIYGVVKAWQKLEALKKGEKSERKMDEVTPQEVSSAMEEQDEKD